MTNNDEYLIGSCSVVDEELAFCRVVAFPIILPEGLALFKNIQLFAPNQTSEKYE
jgi:hypothetical protein